MSRPRGFFLEMDDLTAAKGWREAFDEDGADADVEDPFNPSGERSNPGMVWPGDGERVGEVENGRVGVTRACKRSVW